jgi:hypothetical protein
MSDEAPSRSEPQAVLQMEIDLTRWIDTKDFFSAKYHGETPWDRLYAIAKTAACDTLTQGGSLVIIRSGDIVTLVQRPEESEEEDAE